MKGVTTMANKSNVEENIRIGRLLKLARENSGLLQSDMIEETGLSKNHISAVERGVSKPSVECLLGYCDRIGVTPNDILQYEGNSVIPELVIELSKMDNSQQKRVLEIVKILLKENNIK